MSSRADARRRPPAADAQLGSPAPRSEAGPDATAKPVIGSRWIPSIFAAKTTASGLLALLVAFTFNLDQPKWALLTVFIVAQPQSGLVLAKSFYRIIGTVVGAAGALVLVSLFAQERVLFLGTLAIWLEPYRRATELNPRAPTVWLDLAPCDIFLAALIAR